MTRRQGEAVAILRDETVYLECFFLERTEDGDYLVGVMTAEHFQRSQEAVRRSTHSTPTRQFKRDTWESGQQLELLVETA